MVEDKLLDEAECIERLLRLTPYDYSLALQIKRQARKWVQTLRAESDEHTLLDSFLAEYGLSNEEGVALMCLAEAFLRIPDDTTQEMLIRDKLGHKDWERHLGRADSWLVNSSTWALMLTGRVLSVADEHAPDAWFNRLVGKLGQPLLQTAVRQAMQILGQEFVVGETIEAALRETVPDASTVYSFDMLGEGARNRQSAERYRAAYAAAIAAVAREPRDEDPYFTNSVSIKISALHPRYEPLKQSMVEDELYATLLGLCELAQRSGVPVSIDAEEADRLQFSLDLFARLCRALPGWSGLGLVVQAYGKRAPRVIDWAADLARETDRRLPVRLVKGAYWDAEIKHAQEQGLRDYPVYTRKPTTDAAYLVCARKMLDATDAIYPQFATHNAHTVAAIVAMCGAAEFECQRLHGMGEHLYKVARRSHPDLRIRVYAPVGEHRDLLAYLVRRLLENGANSSFVNRLFDAEIAVETLVQDPFDRVRTYISARHPNIPLPEHLYGSQRRNSQGVDLADQGEVEASWSTKGPPRLTVESRCTVAQSPPEQTVVLAAPGHTTEIVSDVAWFDVTGVSALYESAVSGFTEWSSLPAGHRANILLQLADLLEAHKHELYTLLSWEVGKTVADCVGEVREAVDFCRYYAQLGKQQFSEPSALPGPTGEDNFLSLHGRGVFVCISPWNFPLAIFVGQVAAALMAGNAVIAKPAETTPRIAVKAAHLMLDAGLPEHVCQVVIGGAELGAALVHEARCAGVAFTGSTRVARRINLALAEKAGAIVPLIAETGGQNAMIVDSTALMEQVTDDVVHSAFYSAGQRCSALRVLCLQEDIADDALAMIKGAMAELVVGPAHDSLTDVGPIITATAHADLLAYVATCKANECGVYTPDIELPGDGHFMHPTIIELNSIEQLGEEVFGPVLHVVRFDDDHLVEVVERINTTGYGLTFGIHSRLDHRIDRLVAVSRAGNVYVNRNMIGAVVGVQPFGGQGLSGTGPKAGGPHYLLRFCSEKTVTRNTTATGGNLDLLA